MSKLQYPEAVNPTDLQIWNNAAFDSGDSIDTNSVLFNCQSDSIDSFSSKENRSPLPIKSSLSIKTPANLKPLNPNSLIVNSQGKPTKVLIKPCFFENPVSKNDNQEEVRDEKRIDSEIEEVQMEISRLSKKLDDLKVEKAKQKLKILEKKGKFVSAKFLEQKQGVKIEDGAKKFDENLSSLDAKTRLQRRGVSMGPNEIIAKSRQMGKLEITPGNPINNRRKSCFWKIQEIDELKVIKERGKCSSVSPKSRKAISKTPFSRQAVTTVGAKKAIKKEDFIQIKPKKLFGVGEKSPPVKKPMKPGRVVASRYNQGSNSTIRKRSLPDNEKDEIKRFDKKRASSSIGSSIGSLPEIGLKKGIEGSEIRIKKHWDVNGEVVIHSSVENDDITPVSDLKVPNILLKIKTTRGIIESPRDSGPAKRVSELVERKSYFCDDEKDELEVFHELDYDEEE